MSTQNLRTRFVTKAPSHEAAYAMADVREVFADFADMIDGLAPDSREKSLALTKLEEAKYYTNQSIILADNQKEASE